MTFAELQSAVDAAQPGDTVYVTSDVEVTGTLVCTKRLTIRSSPGTTNTLRYVKSGMSKIFLDAGAATDVMFADLTIDGQKATLGKSSGVRFMSIQNGGKVTFDSGFTFKDYYCGISQTIMVGSNGLLTMNAGATMSGIENDKNGTVVSLTGASTAKGQFVMTGGEITGCRGHSTSSGMPDGIVYVTAGQALFTMTGGTIAGNTSDNYMAGVYVTQSAGSSFVVSGAAFVTNNVGGVGNDVYIVGGAWTSAMPAFNLIGDFTGRLAIQISTGGVYEGRQAFLPGEPGRFTGGGNIEVVADDDGVPFAVDAYTTSRKAVFTRQTARVGVRGQPGVRASGLSEAFAIVQSGEQIALMTNLHLSAALKLESTTTRAGATNIVLCSDQGGPYRVTWDVAASGSGSSLINIDNRDAAVPFRLGIENLVFDGENEAKSKLFRLGPYSVLSLGEGAILENIYNDYGGAAVSMNQSDAGPARLEMNDGAIIRNCTAQGNGAAVEIATTQAGTLAFVMRGGVISNNVSLTTTAGYGGAVSLSGGYLAEMSGGAIVGNRAPDGIAGLNLTSGTLTLSGTACITNNIGAYNDAYMTYARKGLLVMRGDFRGFVGVSGSRQQALDNEFCTSAEAGATGAWRFHAVGPSPAKPNMIGTRVGDVLKWGLATGTVGGEGIVADEEIQAAVATGISVASPVARAALPLVLGGRATALAYTVPLSFDEEELYHSGELPLTLCTAAPGEALTGSLTPVLSEGLKHPWRVKKVGNAYVLRASDPGLMILFR